LREGKRTLILNHALRVATAAERSLLLSVVGKQDASLEEMREALSIIKASGALMEVEELARSLISQGLESLQSLPESDSKQLLRSWATYTLARTY
jgi:geranylgeranyl diphosphate synthase type I